MGVLQLLVSNGYITLNKKLMKAVGIEEAIIFGELCGNYEYRAAKEELDEDESFYCTVEDLEDKTTFSEYKQRKAFKKLESLGLIRTKLKGVPPKRYIQIDEQQIMNLFDIQIPKNSGSKTEKIQDLNPEKLRTNNNTTNKNTVNNKYNKKENREKKKFGEFGNVLLTDEEYNKLIDRYGEQTTERFIKNLDLWLGEGHTKKSHYMTIIRWVENEKEKGAKSYAGNTGTYRPRNETGYHGFTPSTGVKTEPDF